MTPPPTVVYRPASAGTWVEKAAGVCGGEARIRQTRIPIWVLVGYHRAGLSDNALLRLYPTLTAADLACAWEYTEQNPHEIDEALARHDAA